MVKMTRIFDPHNLDFNDIEGLIRGYTGQCESHYVQTVDGYILKIFRIPRENPKEVILLQHPMFFDARIWVSQYNKSIAFFFWRSGYDVWLGNVRGDRFCQKHVTLEPSDPRFWDFSFHEMGFYDNHAIIEYIKHKTNFSKIVYLGLSMGATSGLVYASTRNDICAESVKLMVLLAPASHMNEGTSFAKYTVPLLFKILGILKVDLRRTILHPEAWYVKLVQFLSKRCRKLTHFVVELLAGFSDEKTDLHLLDVIFMIFGQEIPLKLWCHFNQLFITGGKFCFFDYGEKNVEFYGLKEAPFYPIDKIKTPILLVYGENDSFQCIKDYEVLYKDLCRSSKIHKKMMTEGFNHTDFTLHSARDERVYSKVLQVVENL